MRYCLAGIALGAALHFSLLEFSIIAADSGSCYCFPADRCRARIHLENTAVCWLAFAYAGASGALNLYAMRVTIPYYHDSFGLRSVRNWNAGQLLLNALLSLGIHHDGLVNKVIVVDNKLYMAR